MREQMWDIQKTGMKTWGWSEKKKILVSENPLKNLHGKISDFGKLSSLGFWGLMLIHTCIKTWFHRFTQLGKFLAKNLAGGLQHGCQLSFSTKICPTILQYNPFLYWSEQRVLSSGMHYKQDGSSWDRKMCIFVAMCGVCSLQNLGVMGLPKALPAMQSVTSHHEPI